jgi:hypothetical protein
MDEATAKFVGKDKPSDITFVIAGFPTATQARAALEDLMRWAHERGGLSAWRIPDEHGATTIVAVCMLTASGHKNPVIGRLKRKGGGLRDLPEDMKIQLANRMFRAAAKRESSMQWGEWKRLEEPPPEGQRPIELP